MITKGFLSMASQQLLTTFRKQKLTMTAPRRPMRDALS
jgi:hypothetical protein